MKENRIFPKVCPYFQRDCSQCEAVGKDYLDCPAFSELFWRKVKREIAEEVAERVQH